MDFRPVSVHFPLVLEQFIEKKDPRFLFGFGWSFLNDDLEEFFELREGKEDEKYKIYSYNQASLLDLAASFGSERIFNFDNLNLYYLHYFSFCFAYIHLSFHIHWFYINLFVHFSFCFLGLVSLFGGRLVQLELYLFQFCKCGYMG